MIEEPNLGVVAIGRNEGERLRRCLRSMPAGLPVVYVDSGSNDGSIDFAKARGVEVIALQAQQAFTAARARNEGLRHLSRLWPSVVYVQFVDGDCEFEKNWFNDASALLESRPEIAAVCGRRRERFPDDSFYNRMFDEEWSTPVGQSAACGGDAMFRVAAVQDAGGYDPVLIAGEEPELCSRLRANGWCIWRLDAPMTIHDASMHRFGQWWRRAVRSGYGYAQVWHKTKRARGAELYGRELGRAVGWTIGPPLLSLVICLFLGITALFIAPAIWLLQFLRLSNKNGMRKAAHLLIGKAAECLGAWRYLLAWVRTHQHGAIFYK